MMSTASTIESRASTRRAAILVTSLDSAAARRVLEQLQPMQRARLRRAITELQEVDALERKRAQTEFFQAATKRVRASIQQTPSAVDQRTATKNTPAKTPPISKPQPSEPEAPLAFLSDVPDDILLGAIIREHPQTVAIVLASLAPHQAARLLPELSDSLRLNALKRLAKLEQPPPDALDSIGSHLRRLLADVAPKSLGNATGNQTLNAILSELAPETKNKVLNQLETNSPIRTLPSLTQHSTNPQSASSPLGTDPSILNNIPAPDQPTVNGSDTTQTSIDQNRTIDPFLSSQTAPDLRDALATLEPREALLALCGLTTANANRVLQSLPRRQAREIRKRLSGLESLQLHEIDRAKQQVALQLGWQPASSVVTSTKTTARSVATAA